MSIEKWAYAVGVKAAGEVIDLVSRLGKSVGRAPGAVQEGEELLAKVLPLKRGYTPPVAHVPGKFSPEMIAEAMNPDAFRAVANPHYRPAPRVPSSSVGGNDWMWPAAAAGIVGLGGGVAVGRAAEEQDRLTPMGRLRTLLGR